MVPAGAEWYFGAYLAQCLLGRRSMSTAARSCCAAAWRIDAFPADSFGRFRPLITLFLGSRFVHTIYHTIPYHTIPYLPLVSTATAKQRE